MKHLAPALALALALVAVSAVAQNAMPTTFPDAATPLGADDLKVRLSGNVFSVKPASGPDWRLQYKDDGYFYVNVGAFSDTGKWRTQDGKLCAEGRKINASCNEVRATPEHLYLKRDSGEVITLVKQ